MLCNTGAQCAPQQLSILRVFVGEPALGLPKQELIDVFLRAFYFPHMVS